MRVCNHSRLPRVACAPAFGRGCVTQLHTVGFCSSGLLAESVGELLGRLAEHRVAAEERRTQLTPGERLRQEQDAAYERSLAADAKKAALAAEAAKAQAETAALLERRQAEHGALIAEIQRAIPPEPDAGRGVLRLSFEVPDGRRIVRRFSAATPMSILYSWAFLQIASTALDVEIERVAIMTWLPRRVFPSAPLVTLEDAGIVNLMKLFIVYPSEDSDG